MTTNFAIGNNKPKSRKGSKLDNGFEDVYKNLTMKPGSWVSVHDIPLNVAYSLKREVKKSDIGPRTSFSTQSTDDGKYDAFLRYLPE